MGYLPISQGVLCFMYYGRALIIASYESSSAYGSLFRSSPWPYSTLQINNDSKLEPRSSRSCIDVSSALRVLLMSGSFLALKNFACLFSDGGSGVPVFLVSLKAGGTGLTLLGGPRAGPRLVILFDHWWNPAAEAQAIDRVHR